MRDTLSPSNLKDPVSCHAPALIAGGVAILTANAIWPVVPAVTGMALIALGATGVMQARFRGTVALVPATLMHLAVYGGLYALFVGATIHTAAADPSRGLGVATLVDLTLSVWPMGLVLCQVGGTLIDPWSAD